MIEDDNADIAIVGLACRFPGARDAAEFWRNLAAGVESITPLSDDEILASGVPAAQLESPHYVKAAAVLDEPGGFDAAFFGFVPSEARTMDPQHRILLELAHAALEDAGCDPERFPGRVGVFSGSAMNTYFMHAGLDRQFAQDYIPTLIVNDKDFLSTRISYKLNLKGPSITVQTACSTSLVAIHLARQSLLSEETDVALAGAISVRAPHRAGYFADGGGVSSPDGHVRAFDAGANGTLFGSGGGVVVMKRLRDAVAEGDPIRAIIKGSAVNNDGAEKAGYTAPSVNSQADAIVEALANADVEADAISYIEAHGSGTPVGDPIEIRALTKAFRASTQRKGFCAIGSVKTNVGHLDAAAGMAGLIKTVLAMEHRQIPASLNYSQPNPEIDFPSTPFFVNTQLAPWSPAHGPRRAGIMSTGMGGTNAHVVLEEAPAIPSPPVSAAPKLLVLSARTESALATSAEQLRHFLEANPATDLDAAAVTLQSGRRAMVHRRFVVGTDHAGFVAALAASPKRQTAAIVAEGARRPLVLLLPGVGDHYVGMGRELYGVFPAFRREVDRCAEILRPLIGLDIRELLYPKNRDWQKSAGKQGLDLKKMLAGNVQAPEDEDTRRLNHAVHLQPALFTIEYALAGLWKDLGLAPEAIVGHSMGEYVAATLAGVFSLEDALRLIVRRTQLADSLPPASMLAVPLPEAEVQALLPEGVSISLINGPNLCIVAGPPPLVEQFARTLHERGQMSRMVQNTHAFHSRVLDPIVGAFEAEVRKARLSRPKIPFISNVSGRWISDAEAVDPTYWAKHLNHTARFNDALATLWQMETPLLLEAGPGKTLGVLANQHPAKPAAENPMAIWSLRHHYENQPDVEVLLNSVGKLWILGAEIQWEKMPSDRPRRKISLPTYPFERKNFWMEPGPAQTSPAPAAQPAAAAPPGIDHWFYTPTWKRTISRGNSGPKADAFWVIIADRPEHTAGFRKLLQSKDAAVACAHFGGAFERLADDSWVINPGRLEDYLKLFREIPLQQCPAMHIVHLGCLEPGETTVGESRRAQDFGFFSLLYLAQAIGELNITIPVSLGVVSSQIHEVTGTETLRPEMATVLGPCGVIPKEFPNITCFHVDLQDPGTLDDSIGWILSEFADPAKEDTIAYRGRHRWKRIFESVDLPAPISEGLPRPKRLRQGGVYLITGGAGGIGLVLARYLAEACQARIVLTRRTGFPEKAEWRNALAAENTPEPTARLIRELLEMESLGAEIEVMVAEVSDLEQMRGVIEETQRKFGGLNGVIHAAGIARAGLIQTTTREMAEAMFLPKIQGTLVLHELLPDIDLDFLVLFSSMASITAPFAHVDYSAANAFLDAFAAWSNSRRRYPSVAINWPVWKEVGMVAKLEAFMGVEDWREAALKKAILNEDGLEGFRRTLNSDLPQVVVSPEPLESVLAQAHESFDPAKSLSTARASTRVPGVEADQPTDEIETVVSEIWSTAFGLPQIGIHERFTDLGGHSLLALQIVTRTRGVYGVDIALREFFESPTVAGFSTVIREKLILEIASLTDDEVRELIANGPEK